MLGGTIASALESDAADVTCVLGAEVDAVKASITSYRTDTIVNSDFTNGLGSSISKGIEHLQKKEASSVLVLLGDQPFVSAAYINELIKTHQEDEQCIIASDYDGAVGVPAIFPRKYFDELVRLEGDVSGKHLLNNIAYPVRTISGTTNLIDIDTLSEYESLKEAYV